MSEKNSKRHRFQQVEVDKLGDKRVVISAEPDAMTAFAGAGFVRAAEERFGLIAKLAQRVHDRRLPHLITHSRLDILRQRICQTMLGYSDGNDCDWLRDDPAIKWMLGRDPLSGVAGASQPTTCVFENNALDKENVRKVQDVLIDHYLDQHRRLHEVEIDFDGSSIKTHGAQEGAIYRGGPYQHEMYFPLMAFIGGWLVSAVLRTGTAAEAKTILAELEHLVAKLRAKFPRIRITVRLDAAFGSAALYKWCRSNRVNYLIAVKGTSALDLHARAFMQLAEDMFAGEFGDPRFVGKDGSKRAQAEHDRIRKLPTEERMREEREWARRRVRVVGEFSYKAEAWSHWERVLVRCDFDDKGLYVRYVVTSRQRGVPKHIYEDEYCRRGLMEQFIGTLKRTGQRLSAQSFYANQLRMVIYGIAYQLAMHITEIVNVNEPRRDIESIRKELLLMPARMRACKTKILVEVSASHVNCRQFLRGWRRMRAA